MTQRERDILKASVSWTDKVLTVKEEKAFQAGAKWADETMIEKACEVLDGMTEKRLGKRFLDEFRKHLREK